MIWKKKARCGQGTSGDVGAIQYRSYFAIKLPPATAHGVPLGCECLGECVKMGLYERLCVFLWV